jgi:hypothetical protein
MSSQCLKRPIKLQSLLVFSGILKQSLEKIVQRFIESFMLKIKMNFSDMNNVRKSGKDRFAGEASMHFNVTQENSSLYTRNKSTAISTLK